MFINFSQLVDCFRRLKLEGIPKEDAIDALEIDGCDEYDNRDMLDAFHEVYCEE